MESDASGLRGLHEANHGGPGSPVYGSSLVVPEGTEHVYLAQRSEPTTAAQYAWSCEFDFEAMRPYLVKGDVLDIGCGLGGTTVLIARHCGGLVHLLDGTGWGKRRANFRPEMEPFNDRDMTERMMRENGIERFTWHPVGAKFLPPVDNVVSLISWGWHYPVSTYLEAVTRSLRKGGRLILDLRPGQNQEDELCRDFRQIGRYQGFGKCNKTVWERA